MLIVIYLFTKQNYHDIVLSNIEVGYYASGIQLRDLHTKTYNWFWWFKDAYLFVHVGLFVLGCTCFRFFFLAFHAQSSFPFSLFALCRTKQNFHYALLVFVSYIALCTQAQKFKHICYTQNYIISLKYENLRNCVSRSLKRYI